MRCPRCGGEDRVPGRPYCRSCTNAYAVEWRAKDRERARAIGRRAYQTAPRHPRSDEPQRCALCGVVKPATEFAANPIRRSGLHLWCFSCMVPRNYVSSANGRVRREHPGRGVITLADLPSGPCVYCGRDDTRVGWDHAVALARGGLNIAANIVRCCLDCNRSKWANPAPKPLHLRRRASP